MSGATLRAACLEGQLFNVQRIIEGTQDVSGMRSPIYTGIQADGWVARKALVDIISDRDPAKNAAVHICCLHNKVECLEAILSTGLCDVNAPGKNGLSPAAYCAALGHAECLQLLLIHGGASLDLASQPSLLLDAARVGSAPTLSLLLSNGLSPNQLDEVGAQSALHLAVIGSHASAAKVLLQAGADRNAVNTSGQTPLDCCSTDECRSLFAGD